MPQCQIMEAILKAILKSEVSLDFGEANATTPRVTLCIARN